MSMNYNEYNFPTLLNRGLATPASQDLTGCKNSTLARARKNI